MDAYTAARALDYNIGAGTMDAAAYEIVCGAEGFHWGGPARPLILETLHNLVGSVLDGDDWRDAELRIENSHPEDYATSMTVDEGVAMAGQMWSHSYEPDLDWFGGGGTMDAFTDAWLLDTAGFISSRFVEYLRDAADG